MNEQIEEMAKIAEDAIDQQFKNDCPHSPCPYLERSVGCDTCVTLNALYNAGYRKQSEGEWADKPTGAYGRMQSWCSACGKHGGIGGIESNRHKPYCPNCGAKMKGGES